MSRIGKLPVQVPSGVTVTVADGTVRVKGPKGDLAQRLPTGVSIQHEGNVVRVLRADEANQTRASHGLTRALLAGMVQGVTSGFERRLEIQGTGFKAEVKGKSLVLSLGYSHPIEFPFPEGITIEVDKATKLVVRGANKQLVGETAAQLRRLRPPDSYKGKGVRYEGERVRLKAGKTAKK